MMDEKRIEEIVRKVFQKAKKEHASHTRFALSNHISIQSNLSSKTLERAFDRYVDKKKKHGPPNAESIDLLCRYLKYKDYADYLENNPSEKPTESKPPKWKLVITIGISFGAVLTVMSVLRNQVFTPDDDSSSTIENVEGFKNKNSNNQLIEETCMTWVDSLYIPISCDTRPNLKRNNKVEPLNQVRLKNFIKVKVYVGFDFFDQEGKPLIWYYKSKEGELEYYTAPGLHPTNGETLRKITPYIIDKYVPLYP